MQKIKKYYSSFTYQPESLTSPEKNKKRIRKIISLIKKLNKNGKKLLDIGSGDGEWLNIATKEKLICWGIEPSFPLYQQLKAKKIGKRLFNLTFEEFAKKFSQEKFDFIILNHVIEHVRNPKQWFYQIEKILKKNGVVYIETPNLQSHLFHYERKDYTFLTPPAHLWIFSSSSFETMTKKSSLTIRKISTYSHPSHFVGIIKRVLRRNQIYIQFVKKTNRNSYIVIKKLIKKDISLSLKILIFDQLIAPLLTPLLNFNNRGSILQVFIQKP
jgi:2-polyprenyl-3-methyl-5-hydroxy-6-metoxy-1,4-benzoquinol methylase